MSWQWTDDDVEGEPLLDEEESALSSFPDHEAEAHPWIGESRSRTAASSQARARWQRHRQNWSDRLPRWHRRIRLPRLRVEKPIHTIIVLAVIKGTIIASGITLMIALFRLIEDAFCHEHYGKPLSEPIDEKECKGDEVQSKLAFLGGIGMVIGAVASLISAFPYGILADKIGRRPILLLSYAGVVISYSFGPFLLSLSVLPSVWLMLLGSVFTLIGGGIPVMINTIYAMASDISTEETRSSHFLYLGIGAVIAGLFAPVSAGFLMQTYGPWTPVSLVFMSVPFVFVAMLVLPETLRIKLGDDDSDDEGSGPQPNLPFRQAVERHVRSGLKDLRSILGIVRDRNIRLCLLPPLIGNAMWSVGSSTLSQYISKYYGWTLAQTTYILSPLGLVNIVVLAGLPWLSARLVDPQGRYRLSSFRKDLLILRGAYGLMGLALLIQAVSWNIGVLLFGLVVGTFGAVSNPLARAVVTEFVDKKETSRLYATISIMDMLGSFIGGPIVAACFTVGMEKGGVLRGLPFFYVSLLCFGALGAMLLVREPKKPKPSTEPEEETLAGDDMGYESAPEDER